MAEGTRDDGRILHGKVVCHKRDDQEDGKQRIPDAAESLVAHFLFLFHRNDPFRSNKFDLLATSYYKQSARTSSAGKSVVFTA